MPRELTLNADEVEQLHAFLEYGDHDGEDVDGLHADLFRGLAIIRRKVQRAAIDPWRCPTCGGKCHPVCTRYPQ